MSSKEKKIESWDKMKKHMRAVFLPPNYSWISTQQADESQFEQNEDDEAEKKRIKLKQKVRLL